MTIPEGLLTKVMNNPPKPLCAINCTVLQSILLPPVLLLCSKLHLTENDNL